MKVDVNLDALGIDFRVPDERLLDVFLHGGPRYGHRFEGDAVVDRPNPSQRALNPLGSSTLERSEDFPHEHYPAVFDFSRSRSGGICVAIATPARYLTCPARVIMARI